GVPRLAMSAAAILQLSLLSPSAMLGTPASLMERSVRAKRSVWNSCLCWAMSEVVWLGIIAFRGSSFVTGRRGREYFACVAERDTQFFGAPIHCLTPSSRSYFGRERVPLPAVSFGRSQRVICGSRRL